MITELPFFDVSNEDLLKLLKAGVGIDLFNDLTDNHTLRDYLFNLSNEPFFKYLDTAYYMTDEFICKAKKCKKQLELSIFHLNIRSLNAKHRELCMFIDLLEIDFDVLILSEIWSYNLEFYRNIFDGYSFHFQPPKDSTIGGVGMYIKNNFIIKARADLLLTSKPNLIVENLWFEIKKNKHSYIIGGIYRHPNCSIDIFSQELELTLSKLSGGTIPCFVAGDINIDFLKASQNNSIYKYLNCLISNNFLPSIVLPTRITAISSTVIDHIYYFQGRNGTKDFKLFTGNLFSDLSDHLPIFSFLSHATSRINAKDRPFIRLFTDSNKKKFTESLASTDWQINLYSKNNVNECYDKFISVVLNHYENCFPLTRQSRRSFINKKWITKGLRISSRKKERLYKIWIVSKKDSDKINYDVYKKIYTKILRQAKIIYYDTQFNNKTNSIKQLWNNLNRVCSASNKKKECTSIQKLLLSTDVETIEPKLISNTLNDYFCSVGPNLVKNLPTITSLCTESMTTQVSDSIFVKPITSVELCEIIRSLNIKKSCGEDGFRPQLVKENMSLLCEPLLYMFNLSLVSGVVPNKLKIAKIIPIFKKGDERLPCNYRPISLLSIFEKILEILVHRRLSSFFLKHNILYKHQFGFRKNHSSSLALLEIIDTCYQNLDQSKKMLGIYFDLQKAFDTVDHSILLHKLYNYGVRGLMYNWIKDYLTDRKQFTVVNNVPSDIGSISCGVPQGSVLGPLLFLIYINDISKSVPCDSLKLFADDTNLFVFGSTLSAIENEANIHLKKLESWFIKNRLSLNIDKTCYTLFGLKCDESIDNPLKLFINSQQITKASSSKYLGVIIGDSLNWSEHINYVYKKLIKFTSIFYKLRNHLPEPCLTKLYYAFVHPHLLYGLEVYGNTTKTKLDKLCKLNNKILRILLRKRLKTPIKNLYATMNTLPIPILHEMLLLIFVHKFVFHAGLLPDIFQNYFTKNNIIHDHHTRKKNEFHIFCVRSRFGQRCTAHRACIFWNNLPEHLKNISSPVIFKKEIRLYLMNRL